MAKVLEELARSSDPIDRELSRTLQIFQNIRASRNLARSVGYEPRDIRSFGAVEVIERRIRNLSSGFDEVPAEASYEAIVLKYPDRFKAEIVAIAGERLGREKDAFGPTADPLELDRKAQELLKRIHLPFPQGTVTPRRTESSSTVFLRDPRVKAFVLKRSGGRCESCATAAPVKTSSGLEVHHMKTLVQGGSDRVQNAVALCPNCHRALHYASNAAELTNQVYTRVTQLIRE